MIPILTYHQIDYAPPKGAAMRRLYVNPRAFARQMFMLKLLGFRGLCLSSLVPYLTGELQGRVVGITFDDGYLNNLAYAAPILKRYGFSSTCYVVSDFLGGSNAWDLELGVAKAQLMNQAQIKEWIELGQEIGSHTCSHSSLKNTPQAQAFDEIGRSKHDLQALIGAEVHQFCYPYGEYSAEHVSMVRQAGYTCATTTKRGLIDERNTKGYDLLELPRVPVVRSTSWIQFLLKITTTYENKSK